MKIGIIGCGLIGERRGSQLQGHELVGVFDQDLARAEKLATTLKNAGVGLSSGSGAGVLPAPSFASTEDLLSKSGVEIILIATFNAALAPLTRQCVQAGKHVLVEKPGAIRIDEIDELLKLAQEKNVKVKVGFNHRFHPALLKARALIDEGAVGELMFLRARYGHGGRVGYEKEWRAIPHIGGGGELMDQGVHLLDLIYWFMGPLPLHSSYVTTSFWNMEVDDNAVLTLADTKKRWATFHVSCSEWKNTFAMEIYGRTGKIHIQGLGKSYGSETLVYYKMLPEMGPPVTETFTFDQPDNSWALDMRNLVEAIEGKGPLLGDLNSARYALEQVTNAYKENGFRGLPCTL